MFDRFVLASALLAATASCSGGLTSGGDAGTKDAGHDSPSRGDASRDSSKPDAGASCAAGGTHCKGTEECLGGQCCEAPFTEAGVCSVFGACGCMPSQNCVRLKGSPEECAPSGSTPQFGNAMLVTDCARGLVYGSGVCLEPCAGPTCPANFACLELYYQTVDQGYGACFPHCNPVSPLTSDATHLACGAGQTCQLAFDAQNDTVCESPAGTLGQGSACSASTDCMAGYDCTETGVCMQYCRIGFSDCTTGSCGPFMIPRYDGKQEIGLCS
jgi:hypothetical protein